jgi:hypothetical protein
LKDEVAGVLAELLLYHGYNHKLSRVETYQYARNLFDDDGDDPYTNLPAKSLVRGLITWYGTEFHRVMSQDDQHWIKKHHQAVEQLRDSQQKVDILFIADHRFPNENVYIKQVLEGKVIRVQKDECEVNAHPSERSILSLPVDFEVDNNGTLEHYKLSVKTLLDHLLKS